MGFPLGGPTKRHRARQLAAALALLALGRGDPVRLDVLGPRGFLPRGRALPVGSAASAAEALLLRTTVAGRADVGSALLSLSADALSGKHAVLLSDLYGDTGSILRGLQRLVRSGAAVTVLHVLGRSDSHLPPGAQALTDVETNEARAVEPEEAQTLSARVEAWQAFLRAGVTHAGAEWVAVDAGALPGATLRRWLGGKG